jgi:hypothetical protein
VPASCRTSSETRFFDPEDTLAAFALTTMREVAQDRPLGDV